MSGPSRLEVLGQVVLAKCRQETTFPVPGMAQSRAQRWVTRQMQSLGGFNHAGGGGAGHMCPRVIAFWVSAFPEV